MAIRSTPFRDLGIAACAAVVAAGCDGGGGPCRTDADCAGECTITGECVPEGASLFVRIEWTFGGQAPTPGDKSSCGEVAELEVTFRGGGAQQGYRPVPCDAGQFTATKLPPGFDTAIVIAWSETGGELGEVSRPLDSSGETVIEIDF